MIDLRFGERSAAVILGALFLFLFLVSLSLFVVARPWRVRVLFFPQTTSSKLVGERRFLPPRKDLTSRIEQYVQELILGPTDPLLTRVVPKDVRLQSVIAGQDGVYVSLSKEIIESNSGSMLGAEDALQAIADGLLFNFPHIRRLYLLVEGQVPGDQYADGFDFEKKILK